MQIIIRCSFFIWIILLAGCTFFINQDNNTPLVINVLDKQLYEDCHIPSSIQVPFDKVESYVKKFPKDKFIVIYCSNYVCSTSHFVAHKLIEKGYTRIYIYAGGMTEWYLSGYPVEGSATADYLKKEIPVPECNSTTLPTISTKELANALKIGKID